MPDADASGALRSPSLRAYWMAETLRLREALWGPLEDAMEVRRARAEGGEFAQRVLARARHLGRREKLDQLIQQWMQGSRLALTGLCLIALLAGAGAALGALGDGSRPVNLLLALAALLGLNILSLLFWLLSFAARTPASATWLGTCWLWLTRKLARGPDAALVPRALMEVLSRAGALRWLLGGISHALWSIALGSLVLALLGILSARRYSFNWETTLLSPDAFVTITTALGWLPAKLGFAMPSEAIIRASDGLQQLPESAQALWSGWLIACVVVYGLLPRLAGTILSLLIVKSRLAAIELDPGLPGYAELRDRLSPASENAGIDAPSGPAFQAHIQPAEHAFPLADQPLLVGIELPSDRPWPPMDLPAAVADLGVVDSRPQRKRLLDHLQARPPERMLMACDAQQTPDRGVIALLADLAGLAGRGHVALLGLGPSNAARASTWQDRLLAAGFAPEQIHTDLAPALDWLAGTPAQGREARNAHAGP
ncbi:MAG TPA: DUF2868 domain-containing protein [Burkholderiaceae bacterium]|nr:DUF2868 domain-containing protein [Burkholderiaceae bacterium]